MRIAAKCFKYSEKLFRVSLILLYTAIDIVILVLMGRGSLPRRFADNKLMLKNFSGCLYLAGRQQFV